MGFARLGGRAVGVVANQPKVKGGVLMVDSSDKAARFISLCNAFNIPLVYLADVPGFMVGSKVERAGIIRHGAKMVFATSQATVPKICVVVRKCYGAGLYAMCGPAFEPDAALALPQGQVAIMGPEPAVNAVYYNKIMELPEAERAAYVQQKRDEYAQDVDIYKLASEMLVDGIVGRLRAARRADQAAGLRRVQAARVPAAPQSRPARLRRRVGVRGPPHGLADPGAPLPHHRPGARPRGGGPGGAGPRRVVVSRRRAWRWGCVAGGRRRALRTLLFPPLLAAALLVAALWKVAHRRHPPRRPRRLPRRPRGPRRRAAARHHARQPHRRVRRRRPHPRCLLLASPRWPRSAAPSAVRVLVLAPVVGRVAPLLAGAWLAPATPGQGLGAAFAAGLSRGAGPAHVVAVWRPRRAGCSGIGGVAVAAAAWSAGAARGRVRGAPARRAHRGRAGRRRGGGRARSPARRGGGRPTGAGSERHHRLPGPPRQRGRRRDPPLHRPSRRAPLAARRRAARRAVAPARVRRLRRDLLQRSRAHAAQRRDPGRAPRAHPRPGPGAPRVRDGASGTG